MQASSRSTRTRDFVLRFVVFLLTVVAVIPCVRSQQVGGSIAGSVVDPNAATVDRASVLIRNEETGGERSLVTGADGYFSAPSVPVGLYGISVTQDGFAPLKRTGIGVTVGQSMQLHLSLTVGSGAGGDGCRYAGEC